MTAEPFIVHSGLLYINEDGGPKILLLWAIKISPNPITIPPINTIVNAKWLSFANTEIMQLSTNTFICLISFRIVFREHLYICLIEELLIQAILKLLKCFHLLTCLALNAMSLIRTRAS